MSGGRLARRQRLDRDAQGHFHVEAHLLVERDAEVFTIAFDRRRRAVAEAAELAAKRGRREFRRVALIARISRGS
jgi:hypothetical protein